MRAEPVIAISLLFLLFVVWGGYRYIVISIFDILEDRLVSMRIQVRRELQLLESERTRIAHDLHDDLGPLLSAVSIRINSMRAYTEKDEANLQKVKQYLAEVMERTGNISHNLTPLNLTRKGLNVTLQEFFNHYQGLTNAHLEYVYEVQSNLPDTKSLHIYRMVQEIMHNGLKHSNANRIQVCLFEKQRKLHLLYSDNGIGFTGNGNAREKGLGLSSLKTRTEILAGKMKLNTHPGKGVEYFFEIPL